MKIPNKTFTCLLQHFLASPSPIYFLFFFIYNNQDSHNSAPAFFSQVNTYILNKSSLFQYPAIAHMDPNAAIEERKGIRNGVELVKSVSDKHIDLLRPSARYYTASKGQATDAADGEKGKYTLIRDPEDFQGIYDKPLPCFGCGVGWFSFLLGFVFPLMWYYGTFLYFGNYHRRDPRERAGLAAAAIAAMVFSVVLMVIAAYFSLV